MSDYLGDFPEDFATVTVMFTTHDASGAPVAPLSGFDLADFVIYKNGSGTQKTATDGLTVTSPFDSVTGLHCLVIDTSNNTNDVGFWVPGATYTVVLAPDTETVGGVTVLKVLATFGIELHTAALVEPTVTLRSALRLMSSVLLGKASGMATTTAVFRDVADSKDRVTATVDASGNRTVVTLDAT